MGHQQVSGFVDECNFGSTVMFRVTVPALDPVDQILDRPFRDPATYKLAEPGSKVRISRDASEVLVGAGSVYRMTKISEADAMARAGQKIQVIEWAPGPIAAIQAAAAGSADSEEQDEEQDEEADDESNIPY